MATKTPTRKPEMRKLIAEIPEAVFKALKIHSVESDIMMKDLVAQALRQFLKMKEGGEKK